MFAERRRRRSRKKVIYSPAALPSSPFFKKVRFPAPRRLPAAARRLGRAPFSARSLVRRLSHNTPHRADCKGVFELFSIIRKVFRIMPGQKLTWFYLLFRIVNFFAINHALRHLKLVSNSHQKAVPLSSKQQKGSRK